MILTTDEILDDLGWGTATRSLDTFREQGDRKEKSATPEKRATQ